MISAFDDCLMHLHLGNAYQTHRRHEINISACLFFCLYEYFKPELQIRASVAVRNEELADVMPAVGIWLIWLRTTVNVAALHHGAAVWQKPHTSAVDVLWFLTGIELCFSECRCVFLWPTGLQGPITNPLCSFKMPWHQLEYLTGCYSTSSQKNKKHTFQQFKSWIWQQQ